MIKIIKSYVQAYKMNNFGFNTDAYYFLLNNKLFYYDKTFGDNEVYISSNNIYEFKKTKTFKNKLYVILLIKGDTIVKEFL